MPTIFKSKNHDLAMFAASELSKSNKGRSYHVGMHGETRDFHVMDEQPTETVQCDLEGNGELVECELFINTVTVYH